MKWYFVTYLDFIGNVWKEEMMLYSKMDSNIRSKTEHSFYTVLSIEASGILHPTNLKNFYDSN